MTDLEFRMLGPLEVLRGGAAVSLPPGRPRALLAALLVNANQVVPTDRLVDDLWQGDPSPTAGHAIKVYVSNLRKLLEPERQPGLGAEVLVTRRPGYLLVVSPERRDASRFELLVGEGGRALDEGRLAEGSGMLAEALALWRGPVLADLVDEPFVATEATRLEEQRSLATERWAEAELGLGRHAQLVSELKALVRLHPFRERLWAQLIVALYRSGRQADALQAYQRLRRTLGEELGLEPSPELRRLESAVLRHDPGLEVPTSPSMARARAVEDRGVEMAPPLPSRLPVDHSLPFVGRAGERGLLERAWKQAEEGTLQVVLLAGEPGIGKTRLATEIALHAHRRGGVVLLGTCDEDLVVPYQPFVEALRHLESVCPPDILAEALSGRGGELTRLLPDLARRVPGLPPPQGGEPETERYLLFGAVADLLTAVSRWRPVLLLLDDLHWATKPTLLLLKHLIRVGEPTALLCIGAYRDSDIGRGHPLTELLAELRREREVERVRLRGLSDDEAVTMMETLAGHDLAGRELDLAHAVHAETDGSPFFMRELVRHLIDTGELAQRGTRWTYQGELATLGVPDSVREVIGHRVSRLPEPAEQLLTLGAVIGREFDAAVLAPLAALKRSAVVVALDAARRAALVREVEGSPGRYAFLHALIRHTLYDDLGPARRMELHRLVAGTLESLGHADAYLTELARHWVAATPALGVKAHEGAKAARYAEQAGRRAMASLAYEEAANHFEGALHAARQGEDGRRVCELLIVLGEARRCAGDPGHRELLLEAGRLAHQLGDPKRVARAALANQRGAYSRIGAVDLERVAALEAALQAVGPEPSSTRARLLAALATEVHFEGERRRLELAREALALARQLDDRETLAQALAALWFAAWGSTVRGEQGSIAAELTVVAGQLRDRTLQFHAAVCLFLTASGEGDMERADEGLSSCSRVAEELGQPLLHWRVAYLQAHRAMAAGRFDDVERWATESLRLGEAAGQPDRLPFFTTPLATLRVLQGRPEAVEELVVPMIEQFPGVTGYPAILAWALAEDGRKDEARAIIDRLRPGGFAGVPRDYIWLLSLGCLSRACARLEDTGVAEELYELLLPLRGAMITGLSVWFGPVTHNLGLLAAVLGRYEEAEELFADAVEVQDRIGARGTVALTRLEWARMLLARRHPGDAERAHEFLGQAMAIARELGLGGVERRAVELLETPSEP